MSVVMLSTGYFPDPTTNRPVSLGYIYVGEPDTDPTVVANQKTISVLQEDTTTVTVAQPLRTSAGGVPVYNGSPVTILVDGDYSLKVLSSVGTQVYYVPNTGVGTDSKISDYGDDLTAAVLAIGATETNLLIDSASTIITADTVVPANITLDKTREGLITGAFTLTINGGMIGDLTSQWFSSNITVAGLGKITTIKPEWWGVFPDGTTDYGAELQAALTAMPVGSEMLFSAGTYVTSTHLVYKPNRSYRGLVNSGSGSAIKQADSSNIADGILVSEGYNSSSTSPDDPVIMKDFIILGNKANNAGAATVGILSTNYDTLIDNVLVFQTKGDGIAFNNTSVTSGAVGNNLRNVVVRQADGDGIDIGVKYTDGTINNCEFGSSGEYGINNKAAGWNISDNNIYDAGFSGIFAAVGWNTIVSNNIVDGWGQSSTTSDYSGIWVNALYDDLSNTITGNSITMKTADIIAVTNYIGIRVNPLSVATTSQAAITGNSITISATATTSEGFRVGGSGGGGKVIITGNITQYIDATKEIVDAGAGAVEIVHVDNSFDKTFQALAGSGTASVLYGSNFETSDTNIIYSNFTNGFEGQVVNISFAASPGTGYVDFSGTNLKGNNSIDWYFSQNDSMRCVYDGTNWLCDINTVTNPGMAGTFTAANAATTTISNSNVTAGATILVFPTNAAAATLMGSVAALYISARVAGTSFTVATADASSSAGTETFNYLIAY